MRRFYVRPECDSGYGEGDGTSYANAWNGFWSVDWSALRGAPAALWICGESLVMVQIEWSFLKENEREARPDPRRESPLAV